MNSFLHCLKKKTALIVVCSKLAAKNLCISSPLLNLFVFMLLLSFFVSEARLRTSDLYKRVDLMFIFIFYSDDNYLTIRLRARVFYEQIVNEAQPS